MTSDFRYRTAHFGNIPARCQTRATSLVQPCTHALARLRIRCGSPKESTVTTMSHDRSGYRISIVDDDPLRARKEARELLADINGIDPGATLDVPRRRAPGDVPLKGPLSADTVGVLISAGTLVVTGVQAWLARVPQRTIVVTRPDGATLHITGKEVREDDGRIERFLAGGAGPQAHGTADMGPAHEPDGPRPGGDGVGGTGRTGRTDGDESGPAAG
jgi:hypothetical protein